MSERDRRFNETAQRLGYTFDDLKPGGNYVQVTRNGNEVYVSGQIPRVRDELPIAGRVGAEVSVSKGQMAAQISAMRLLALLRQHTGSLEQVDCLLRATVYVQCTTYFDHLSEVADGASAVFRAVMGKAGTHARTTVGVIRLPKNAPVEIDLVARIFPPQQAPVRVVGEAV